MQGDVHVGQRDIGVFAGISFPKMDFAYEIAGVVEHVVDGSGETEQILTVQRRGPGLGQRVNDLGTDLVPLVLDIVDALSGFIDAQMPLDGVQRDGHSFAGCHHLFPEQPHDRILCERVLGAEPRHCGTFFRSLSRRRQRPLRFRTGPERAPFQADPETQRGR